MKIIVCGGRNYTDKSFVFECLDELNATGFIDQIINGGANGADAWAELWAKERGKDCVTIPANWLKFGNQAGPIRNAQMIQMKPDLVVAFPGGKGTANMARQAVSAGIEVWKMERDKSD